MSANLSGNRYINLLKHCVPYAEMQGKQRTKITTRAGIDQKYELGIIF